ncbi:MAG: hypothetical protein KDA33_08215 [Phycisphaerales bacterium]|nr:hypothetical protein [Phycisphaerales bacterium]
MRVIPHTSGRPFGRTLQKDTFDMLHRHVRFAVVAMAGLSLCVSRLAFAQWPSNAASNLRLTDRTGEQTQSKIRATSDGGCYVSWYDNSSGGYDVYLQRLDRDGNILWPHNGVLIADRSFSSTQDYGLAVDPEDNAIITYRDDRATGVQIGVNKVLPSGALAWGANGVLVTNTTASVANPKVTATTDGHYIVGWSQDASIGMQRLDADGTPQWTAGGMILTPAAGSYIMSELQPSVDGSFIALWVRPTGNFLSPKHLYSQRFDADGVALWNSGDPVIIFDANSVQFGYFPSFVTDESGGAVYGWYETGGDRNCYAQHVLVDGTVLYAHNGVAGSIQAGRLGLSPDVSYDAANDDIYLFWTETNTNQNAWGLYGQRFASGVRQWSDNGLEVSALDGLQESFVQSLVAGGIPMAFTFDGSASDLIIGYGFDATGAMIWTGGSTTVSSTASDKLRLDSVSNTCGDALLTWGDARFDTRDIFAQNVNPDGTLGAGLPVVADMNCDGDVTLADVTPFVLALLDADAYAAQFPCCDIGAADVNADTEIDGLDIHAFTQAILGN